MICDVNLRSGIVGDIQVVSLESQHHSLQATRCFQKGLFENGLK